MSKKELEQLIDESFQHLIDRINTISFNEIIQEKNDLKIAIDKYLYEAEAHYSFGGNGYETIYQAGYFAGLDEHKKELNQLKGDLK